MAPRRRVSRELPRPPIADVLKEITGVENIPTGFGWQRLSCPFHEDRTPSASVNHQSNAFNCHSCGRKGDGLKLLQDELGLDFKRAVQRAEALGGTEQKQTTRRRRASDLLGR